MSAQRVYVCTKRGCGGKSQRKALVAELEGAAEVIGVRCQSVCDGPVAGTFVAGRLEWFRRVAKPKARGALVRLARTGSRELPPTLVKRRVRSRAGKLRG